MNTVLFIILAVYMVLMLLIGFLCRKSSKNVSGFILGGRNIGAWMSAFSYGTSYFSAVVFIGYAGQFGWSYGASATWIGIGNALIGSLLAWVVLGRRTRILTKHLNVTTMPEFFEKRYFSKGLKTASALIVFVFLIPYTASVFNGLSTLFGFALPGVKYSFWVIIMAVLTGIYVILGGFKATAVNDFIQGIIMLGGITAVVFYALKNQNGLSEALLGLGNIADSSGNTGTLNSLFGPDPLNLIGVIILTSLGTWGLPQMVHKFYAIKDQQAVKRGAIISTVFAFIVAGGSYFLGGFGRLFCTTDANEAAQGTKSLISVLSNGKPDYDSIIPNLLVSSVPTILFGIVIVLVLSASMSTLASLVLSSSSTLTVDLIKPLAKKMNDKKQVLVMRIFIAVFIFVSALIAIYKNELNALGINISALMSISWGTLAGSFLAPFMYGLFSKRVTKLAVWTSFFTGVGLTVISMILFNLNLFPDLTKSVASLPFNLASPINWGAIAMLVGIVEVPLISLLSKNKNKNDIDSMFECFKREK